MSGFTKPEAKNRVRHRTERDKAYDNARRERIKRDPELKRRRNEARDRCMADPARKALYAAKNRAYTRQRIVEQKYGITIAEFDALHAAHTHCDVCGKSKAGELYNKLSLDHCHTTGRLRGFLCANCNRAIGLFKDNPDLLMEAAAYLERCK